MAYFLCRLVPPRASFGTDMTPIEGALMARHAEHLRVLADAGTVVVFGPVLDPAGVWGLAVLEAADGAAARVIADADPVIRAGAGFSYDIMPMPATTVGRLASGAP